MEVSDVVAVPTPARLSIAGGVVLAVFVASMVHAPADPIGNIGPLGLFGVDKWVHVGSYALIAFLGCYVALTRSVRLLLVIALAATAFGAGLELLQGPIPWRTMEFADVLANALGAFLAVGLWWVLWRLLPTASSTTVVDR